MRCSRARTRSCEAWSLTCYPGRASWAPPLAGCCGLLIDGSGWPPPLPLPAGTQRRFTIGRELTCDMTLGDETVSRWHASLERGPNGWLLDDLGSTNGTRVNGWRVSSPYLVRAGDLVSFGGVTFVLADRPQ